MSFIFIKAYIYIMREIYLTVIKFTNIINFDFILHLFTNPTNQQTPLFNTLLTNPVFVSRKLGL